MEVATKRSKSIHDVIPVRSGSLVTDVSAFGTRVVAADVTVATDASWGDLPFDTRVSAFEGSITYVTGGAARLVTDAQLPGDYNASGRIEQGDLDLMLPHWGADVFAVPNTWISDLWCPRWGVLLRRHDVVSANVLRPHRAQPRWSAGGADV